MLRKILVLMIVVGAIAGFASYGSALFTDSQAVDANAFTSGTVILSTNPTTEAVLFSNMAPGDQYTAPVTVSNDGTLALRYAVTSVATNTDDKELMEQLDLTIKTGVTLCTDEGFDDDGSVIYATGDLGSLAGINLIGNPATGSQAGDRTLAAAANEVLCFHVILPNDSGDAFQGAATTATFTFAAEQTKNNP